MVIINMTSDGVILRKVILPIKTAKFLVLGIDTWLQVESLWLLSLRNRVGFGELHKDAWLSLI